MPPQKEKGKKGREFVFNEYRFFYFSENDNPTIADIEAREQLLNSGFVFKKEFVKKMLVIKYTVAKAPMTLRKRRNLQTKIDRVKESNTYKLR